MKIYNYISKIMSCLNSIILLIYSSGLQFIENLFNFKLIFFPISNNFNIDNAHFLIIFIFLFAVYSIILLLSSLNVTSKGQCIISMPQCQREAKPTFTKCDIKNVLYENE